MKRVLSLVAATSLLVTACSGAAESSPAPSDSVIPASLGAPPSSGDSSIGLVATPLPPGPDVAYSGLIDAADGWAVAGQRLELTADGGSTWRDVTPPDGFASGLLGVDFVDAAHGWVAMNEAFTSASDTTYGRVDILRTNDGGGTWAKTQLPKARFAVFGEIMPGVQFDFLDATHGFAFQSGNEAKGKNDSDLFWTADGGRTWSADRPTGRGSDGVEGMVGFGTSTDGVIVNALRVTGIVVTHDGGAAWADASLAQPPESATTQVFFGQPVFFTGRSGLLFADFQTDDTTVTHVSRVYATVDAGTSWTVAKTLPIPVSALSFIDQQRWIGLSGSELLRTADGGQTWDRSSVVGLPDSIESVRMVDAEHGWATVFLGVCLTFKSNCESRTGLYATADGGISWMALWPR